MKCKICNYPIKLWEDTQLQKRYFYCSNCHGICLDSAYYLTLEKEHSLYNNHRNSLENEGYVKMFEDFLDFFWNDLTCKEKALDFGSGPTPVLSQLMTNRGIHVDYYDKFYQPIKCFEDQTYDLITSTEVFEHLANPHEILKLLAQHLKPDGMIALMTLFHSDDKAHFLTWWYRRDPTHIIFYTPKTLEILARQCGLEVVKTDGKRIAILQKR
ncbi:methyltransferase [Sulfurospirillum diekertiae]|uniref:Methyltransferase n=1 Tax=Sulfurospirillum diekertiae TaxID=1854492 RepID=A0A290HA36_9BACT|nr:class I SAM-dependent methyltransferase [Sulfurospirillum diekertiae]ATB68275.1 methyltransferase [Sulfurospirillum diekertiae]